MLLSFVYFILRHLLHALAPSDRSDLEREAELLVLRHQIRVLSEGRSAAAVSPAGPDAARRGEPDPA